MICDQRLNKRCVATPLNSGGELIEGDVVFDVFGNDGAVLIGDGLEVAEGEAGVGVESGEVFGFDDVAHMVAGGVGLEEILDGREGFGGLTVGDELGEFLLEEFVFVFEARDEAEDFLENFAKGEAAIDGGGAAEFVEGVILLGLVEDFVIDVVDDLVPFAFTDGGGDFRVSFYGFLELLEEHAVDLHALVADGLLFHGGDDVVAPRCS